MKITDIKGTVTLNNGIEMPYLGLGVYKSKLGGELNTAIKAAYDAGYRHIDTASAYKNEDGVAQALNVLEIPREEMFITSKVWNDQQGYKETLSAFQESLDKLQTDYLDLYLVHWPMPLQFNNTWRAMEEIYQSGKVKAIGVSNFSKVDLQKILDTFEVVPTINQIEFHPYLVQQELIDFCFANKIQPTAWRPIMHGEVNEIPLLKELAAKYLKSPVQVVLRWNLQKGIITIPKSVTPSRIAENADLFNFELSKEEIAKIDALNKNHRFGYHPGLSQV